MKWKDLSGEERYRVVQMARMGEVPLRELCQTFGVSRQTLKNAMEKVDRAAMEALTPRSPGRKGKSRDQAELTAMRKEKSSLEKDLDHWKQKYEIAMTFVELQRKVLNGEELPGEAEEMPSVKKKKRRRLKKRKPSTMSGPDRRGAVLAGSSDGGGDGSEA